MILQRFDRLGVEGGVVAVADHEHVDVVGQLAELVHLGGRGDDGSGPAVAEDVGDLAGGEMHVDRGVVEAGPQRRPDRLEVAGMVLEKDGHVIAGSEPELVPVAGQLDRTRLEFAVADGFARPRHHHRGAIGLVGPGVHGYRAEEAISS